MALDKVTVGILADDAVTTAKIADSPTLVTPNIGTPSAGVVTNLSGVLPVGVTGGSGLTAINPTNLAAGLFGAIERTSLTSPNTITATCTLADTLNSAGAIGGDLFGSSTVSLYGGVNQTNAAITFDYGSGVTKYLRYIEWYQIDGAGNSTGIKIRGSDNGTSWTDITTIASAIVNGTTYSYTNTGTTGYRYWQVQYTWSSANRGYVRDFKIHESDSSTLTTLSPATSFPAGHVLQVVHDAYSTQVSMSTTSNTETNLNATITPSSTTNKVLVDWTLQGNWVGNSRGFKCRLWRDDGGGYDNIYSDAQTYSNYSPNGNDLRFRLRWTYFDAPGVLVGTTYKIQAAGYNTNEVRFHDGNTASTIVLTEIVA